MYSSAPKRRHTATSQIMQFTHLCALRCHEDRFINFHYGSLSSLTVSLFSMHCAEYCDELVCRSVSICVSTCISQKPLVQTSQNFLYMLTMAVARSSSDDNTTCCVLPVLWMTSCLPIIAPAKTMPIGCILNVTHQGATPGNLTAGFCSPSTTVVSPELLSHRTRSLRCL